MWDSGKHKIIILTGNRIFWSPRKPDLPKFGHGTRDFFNHMSGIWEILCLSSNCELTRQALSGISSKTRSCMIPISNQTIESVPCCIFFGKKKGIRERDVQNCGMRDFHEKGVGIISYLTHNISLFLICSCPWLILQS